jgi:aspartate/methionine/tyrosine aminotransferase
MKFTPNVLERRLSSVQSPVSVDLSGSCFPTVSLKDWLTPEEQQALFEVPCGYGTIEGSFALRSAVAKGYPELHARQVLITTGTAEANYLALWTLLEPGDEVLLVQPNYPQLPAVCRSLGASVRTVQLLPENRWQLDLAAITEVLTPRTKLIVLCDPNNPTGQRQDPVLLQGLLSLAEQANGYLLIDEVCHWACLTELQSEIPILQSPRLIRTGGLSKGFGIPGLRIGWLVGSELLIHQAISRHDHTTLAPSCLSDWLATCLLSDSERMACLQGSLKRTVLNNLNSLKDWEHGHQPQIRLDLPAYGAFALLRFRLPSSACVTGIALCEALLARHGVLVIPGEDFGLCLPEEIGIRLGLSVSPETFQYALSCIQDVLIALIMGCG